jgi:hypothetical protein
MRERLAWILLRVHILKKTARLSAPEKLRYLWLCYRVHGAMITFCAISAVASVLLAICAYVPRFAVMAHLDSPATAVRMEFVFVVFLLTGAFFGVLFSVLFVTREVLAAYWLLVFNTHYVRGNHYR